MNNDIKNAFDKIHAEDSLKIKTRKYLIKQIDKSSKKTNTGFFKKVSIASALTAICVIALAVVLYFTPSVVLSLEINPGIDITLNRFNKVIAYEGANEDGAQLAQTLNIQNMDYIKAVQEIMTNDTIKKFLDEGEIMSIAVLGENQSRNERIMQAINSCDENNGSIYCCSLNSEQTQQAAQMGLTPGKYKAYLTLLNLDPSITVSQVQNMSMRQIRNLINELSSPSLDDGNSNQTGGEGNHRHRYNQN